MKPGRDYVAEIENTRSQMEDVEREFRTGNWPAASAGRMLANLNSELERLESLQVEPAGEDWTPAGVTAREHYLSLGAGDRNHLLENWASG